MNNKMITGMVTFSFILIIAGGVSSFVLGLKKDQETQKSCKREKIF